MKNSGKYLSAIAIGLTLLSGWVNGIEKASASQDCVENVQAMHKSVWDPFNRMPHRSTKTEYDPEGKVLRIWSNIVQSPLRTISGIRDSGNFALVVDSKVWTGPSLAGPWRATQGFPAGRKEKILRSHQFMIDGIHFAECGKSVVLDGRPVAKYTYKVRTAADKEQGGLWLADTNVIYFDPASKQIVKWEKTDFQSSWAPKENRDRHVFVFEYDAQIRVDAPE